MTTTTPQTTENRQLNVIRNYTLWMPRWFKALPGWVRIALILLILVAVSVWVRSHNIGGQFWMDEAIATGISTHSLSAIPGSCATTARRRSITWPCTSGWRGSATARRPRTGSRGCSRRRTIPTGYWAGWTIARNRRAALITATLFAFNAFLDFYALETRMYTLMALLGLFTTVGFIRGFVYRERRYVVLFAVGEALMLYTHNWALFYGAGAFISLVILYFVADDELRENLVRDVIAAFVGAAILFVPWIPNFFFQTAHTAAPWDAAPRFGVWVQVAQSVFGGASISVVMLGAALFGYSPMFGRPRRRQMSREALVAWMLLALPVITLAVAWLSSHVITPAWDVRYFAPIVAPMLLLLAIGISRAGIAGFIAMLFVICFMARPSAFIPSYKSDMQTIAGQLGPLLHKDDLVIVGQPEQVPLAYYYLPGGLKWSSTIGPVKDPSYVNWVDAMKRYRAAKPSQVVPKLLSSLKDGQQLLVIRPLTEGTAGWVAPWTKEIRRRSAQWLQIIGKDKQLVIEATAPENYRGACCIADAAILYKKV